MNEERGWRRRGLVVSTLGITQLLAWGSTYYLPAIFADSIATDLHISHQWFFAIFSGALLLSGVLGPLAGRMIDRHGGRDVLAGTNLVFAAGLALLATAHGFGGLVLAWTVLGIGMGFGLYEPSFATVAGLYGRNARNAITGITLIGGFAGTVGWPANAYFIGAFGWRGGSLAWAVLHLVLGLPLNWLLVPRAAPAGYQQPQEGAAGNVSSTMIALAFIFAGGWFVSTAMIAHLPRLLEALGATPAAAVFAGALIGPCQVGARLVEYGVLRRVSPMVSARLAVSLHPIRAVCLAIFGAPAGVLFVVLHGAGNGLLTIARGTLPLALFGPAAYGLRTGLISAPSRILQAGSPLLFGVLLDRAGPLWALALSGTLTGACFLGLLFIRAPAAPTRPG